jgi:hypothetical protein
VSKGSRQNGFVPLVKRLALVVRQFGYSLKLFADPMDKGGPAQVGKFFEVGRGSVGLYAVTIG